MRFGLNAFKNGRFSVRYCEVRACECMNQWSNKMRSVSFKVLKNGLGSAKCEGLDGDHGVDTYRAGEDASIRNKQSLNFPTLASRIHNGAVRIRAHFAATHLVARSHGDFQILHPSWPHSVQVSFDVGLGRSRNHKPLPILLMCAHFLSTRGNQHSQTFL